MEDSCALYYENNCYYDLILQSGIPDYDDLLLQVVDTNKNGVLVPASFKTIYVNDDGNLGAL